MILPAQKNRPDQVSRLIFLSKALRCDKITQKFLEAAMVKRIYVEKRNGFDVPAQQLLEDFRETPDVK